MKQSDRIVTKMPLTQLWNSDEEIDVVKKEYLTKAQLKLILKQRPVEFVVASIGNKLRWIEIENCYEFWKTEVEKQVAEDYDNIFLDDFPGEYAYVASEWVGAVNPIVLLEMHH